MSILPHEVHPLQTKILRELLFHPEAKFSELNQCNTSSDQFSFHLKRLIDGQLLKKNGDHYELTAAGKEFANRFDMDGGEIVLEKQAKLGALTVCVMNNGEEEKYLLQQRLKQPYYGFFGFVGGKIRWGETLVEAASRELREETGLTATLSLAYIEHKMDYWSKTGELLEDKFFYVFRGDNFKGTLRETFQGGKNSWVTKQQISTIHDVFPGVREGLELIDKKNLNFVERKCDVEKY